jgi:aryl-alcohol dehydrogenase-like predicted oxidoreductase
MSVTLGTTSLDVSRIGLGLAALGRPGYITVGHAGDLGGHTDVAAMEAHAHQVLDAAYADGVRYFDAARSYGRAEEFLGSWLTARGLGAPEVTVGSKWGYTYTADWRVDAEVNEVKDLSVEHLRRQETESRSFLGSDLRLYQIHSATIESGVLEDPAVRDELARLRAEGLYIGFTATGPRQRDTIERAVQSGGFDTVQATWNLLESSAGSALAAAHEAGLGVIVKEAVANGRLTSRGDVPLLLDVARQVDETPDALALAAVLAQPWVDVVLSGAATTTQLASNLTALSLQVGDELLERLGRLREDPETYWRERGGLSWN